MASSTAMALLVVASLAACTGAIYTGKSLGPSAYVWASGGAPLNQPPVLSSSNGYLNLTLTVQATTVSTGLFSFATRAWFYSNSIASQGAVASNALAWPGPTLKVKQGTTLYITLTNALGANPTTTSYTCCGVQLNSTAGSMPMPNTVNLHFHGLSTPPEQDSIFNNAQPAGSLLYRLTIPSDHAPGCHWYHSHVHGAVAMHVMGGLVGSICVEPNDPTTTLPASLNAMTRYNLNLHHVSETSANPSDDPFMVRPYPTLASLAGSTLAPNFQWTDPTLTLKDVYLVNGQMQPSLALPTNNWVVLDLVNAVGDHTVELEIRTAVMGGTRACEMYVLALDGIYLNTAPRYRDFVAMTPGMRTSVAVRCKTAGTFYLQTWGDNTEAGHADVADYEVKFNQMLATLVVSGTVGTANALPTTLATIPRPSYMTDLTTTTPSAYWDDSVEQTGANLDVIVRGGVPLFWIGIGTNCTLACGGRGDCTLTDARTSQCGYVPFGGQRATKHVSRHSSRLGAVTQLTVRGRGKTPHPMHLHTMHVQLQQDVAGGAFGLKGDWRDTVAAVGTVVVRYRSIYAGEIPVHCHFLFHEDHGMMDTIFVLPSDTSLLGSSNYCTWPSTCTV